MVEAVRGEVLGKAAAEAYRRGDMALKGLVREYQSRGWRLTRYTKSLKDVLSAAGGSTPPGRPASSDDVRRMTQEIGTINRAVSRLTGLQSHWSGILDVDPNLRWTGEKLRSCTIKLNGDPAQDIKRFSTGTHEVLHAHSVGLFESGAYVGRRGYEEGVVEQTERVLRDEVLADLGFSAGHLDFRAIDAESAHNGYIERLEEPREMTQRDARTFYVDLLRTPLVDREETILRWIERDSQLSSTDARLATQVRRSVLRQVRPPTVPR
jgi:hypothetical protein